MTSWMVIVGVGLGSYAFRLVPLMIGARAGFSDRVERSIHHAGVAALTALVVSSLLHVADTAGRAGVDLAGLIVVASAAAASLVVSVRSDSMLRVVATGFAVFIVADQLHMWLMA